MALTNGNVAIHHFCYNNNNNNREELPAIFESYFVQNKCIHSYDTGRKCDLHLISTQLMVGKKSIANKGCSLSN